MTQNLAKNAQSALKDLVAFVDVLEARVDYVKEGLQKLLEEEDVKLLPSYGLLQRVYREYLKTDGVTAKSKGAKGEPEKLENLYDSMHMPKSLRVKVKAKSPAVATSAAKPSTDDDDLPDTAPAKEERTGGTRHMPDLSVSMLDDEPNPKKKIVTKKATAPVPAAPAPAQQAPPLQVKVPEGETVYVVEIKGQRYWRYDRYLYSPETGLRVGFIDTGFNIGDTVLPIEEKITLKPVSGFDNYYSNSTGDGTRVYILVNDTVAQAVGSLNDEGDLCLEA